MWFRGHDESTPARIEIKTERREILDFRSMQCERIAYNVLSDQFEPVLFLMDQGLPNPLGRNDLSRPQPIHFGIGSARCEYCGRRDSGKAMCEGCGAPL